MNLGMENSLFGLGVEEVFDYACRAHGLMVSRPDDYEWLPWDRVVSVGGVDFKVQIKSTKTLAVYSKGAGKQRARCYMVSNRRETKGRPKFWECGVDVMAAYVKPLGRWQLYDAKACKARWIKIHRNPSGPGLVHIERWGLFAELAADFIKKSGNAALPLAT
jgi:hypothetical protein